MSEHTSKLGFARVRMALILVLSIAGLLTMIISSTMSKANSLYGLSMLVALAVAGVALAAILLFAPQSWRKNGYLSLIAIVGSIALFTAVIGSVINGRILLISGLFSYNAANMVGWSVFYVTVASIVCFLAAILLLIVSAFMKSSK